MSVVTGGGGRTVRVAWRCLRRRRQRSLAFFHRSAPSLAYPAPTLPSTLPLPYVDTSISILTLHSLSSTLLLFPNADPALGLLAPVLYTNRARPYLAKHIECDITQDKDKALRRVLARLRQVCDTPSHLPSTSPRPITYLPTPPDLSLPHILLTYHLHTLSTYPPPPPSIGSWRVVLNPVPLLRVTARTSYSARSPTSETTTWPSMNWQRW